MHISQIYKKYLTPKNLQEHMLRVASLSKIITDNWTGPQIDGLAIIKACAMHDIAKPVNFSTSKETQEKYGMSPEDVANLEKLINYIGKNFGTDEHKAAVEMGKDMDLGDRSVEILENLEWEYTQRLLKENNMDILIALYCDMRIGPKGILPLEKRYSDLKDRRGGNHDNYFKDAVVMEKVLQKNTLVDLNSVTDADLNSLFPILLNLEI